MANKLVASIQLMRVKNLGLALIATPLGAAFALLEFGALLDYPEVALATLSVLFFMAAGNALNDLSDVEIDKIAHPSRPIANGSISISESKLLIGLLSLFSLLSLLGCLYLMEGSRAYTAGIYVAAVVLMLTYDHGPRTKQKGLVGNIAISSLVAAVVLYGASSIEGLDALLCWYVAGVVFFVNLAREIIKDCQDMEADSDSRQTLPMKIGKENSRDCLRSHTHWNRILVTLAVLLLKSGGLDSAPWKVWLLDIQLQSMLGWSKLIGAGCKSNSMESP